MKNLKIYLIITVLVVLALSTMLIKTNNSVIILNNTKRELLATNEIEEANYKVESPLTYTKTLGEAVNVADENSTITVLKDCNDDSEVTISKNLTIDLQDKSLKREGTITVNNGAVLTARGSGEIIQDGNSNMFTLTNSAKLVKRGTALWRAWEGYAIHSTNSSFELYGGYVVSDFSRTIYANNIQKSLIKDTTVYTGTYTDYAIRATGNGNLTIGGNSKIGNGPQVSVNGNLEPVSVIGWASTGFLPCPHEHPHSGHHHALHLFGGVATLQRLQFIYRRGERGLPRGCDAHSLLCGYPGGCGSVSCVRRTAATSGRHRVVG